MITITRILCPVDQSDTSRRALEHAIVLARWYDARVTALEVIQMVFAPTPFSPVPAAGLTADARRDIEAGLRAFVAATPAEGVHVDTVVREGLVVDEVLDAVATLPADLIVMGTHGRSGVQRLILGSVAERILRRATCPVLTVPPHAGGAPDGDGPFRNILCPVDFSPASMGALGHALSLAQESAGRLTVLHVLDWPVDRPDPAGAGPDLAAYRRDLLDQARHELAAAIPDDARHWCEPEELVLVGRPWETILATARDRACDVVVMGVHGRRVFDLHVFGSTTDHVVREAACPVLTIRP